ncbi:zinc finger CCCH domain-containing protein 40 [Scenedesmus sp. PABB004]|nr:zinc finger CCCH domain-containing protein 40 [Scenedesmus sp. PABB004]
MARPRGGGDGRPRCAALLLGAAAALACAAAKSLDELGSVTSMQGLAAEMYRRQAGSGGAYMLLNSTGRVGSEGSPDDNAPVDAPLLAYADLPSPLTRDVVVLVPVADSVALMRRLAAEPALQQHVRGVLVDDTEPPPAYSCLGPFPGAEYAPYDAPGYAWNAAAGGAAFPSALTWLPAPALLLAPGLAFDARQRAAYNARGVRGTARRPGAAAPASPPGASSTRRRRAPVGPAAAQAPNRKQYHARLRLTMSASGAPNSSACVAAGSCKPLGGYSVWAALPPLPPQAPPAGAGGGGAGGGGGGLPIILVVAQMDGIDMFHDSIQGADAPLSGLVALLGALQVLRGAAGAGYTRRVVFLALAGEPWGYMGSRRLLWEASQGSNATAGLDLALVEQVIEVGQVGRLAASPAADGGGARLFAHAQRGPAWGNASAVVAALQAAAGCEAAVAQVKVRGASPANPGIPPSSLMSFLRAKPAIEGVVLAEFDEGFVNPFFSSRFDNAITLRPAGVAAAAAVLAGGVHRLAGGDPAALDINMTSLSAAVAGYLACVAAPAPGFACPAAAAVMAPDFTYDRDTRTRSYAPRGYVGVLPFLPPTQGPLGKANLPRFVWNVLALGTAAGAPGAACDPYDRPCADGLACAGWRGGAGDAGLGACVNASVRYVPSFSTRFACDDCGDLWAARWRVDDAADAWAAAAGWPPDPMWAESDWPAGVPELRLYLREARRVELAVLAAGFAVTAAAAVASVAARAAFEGHFKAAAPAKLNPLQALVRSLARSRMQMQQAQQLRRAGAAAPFGSGAAAAPRPAAAVVLRRGRVAPVLAAASGLHAAPAGSFARGFAASAAAAAPRRAAPRGRASRLAVRASWGAPVDFTPAKVVSNTRVAEQLHAVVVDVGDLAAGYTAGGQYMQIKVGEGKPGFFAIASPPDPNNQGLVEFLIKAQGEAAEALAGLGAGAEVAVSPVMGKGFPVDRIPPATTPTVLLFATGSGISPIKALIESGALEADKRSDVRLYYGTRDADHTAYAGAIPAWEAAGVKVVQVFSNGGAGEKYVQDVFAAAKGLGGGDGVGVVLCGQKEMCNAVKELVAAEGVEADKAAAAPGGATMAARALADPDADGWERSDFPIVCETCLGPNPYVRMQRIEFGGTCHISGRPYTVFRWRPGNDARYKKTIICQEVAKAKNVCQVCLFDLDYGLPVQVRDTALGIEREDIPESDVGKEFQLNEQIARGQTESSFGDGGRAGPSNDMLMRLQRTSPYYKRNQARLCSFFARGACTRGAECPYRHEMPVKDELSEQNIKDRYYGINDPVANKMLRRFTGGGDAPKLEPPEDKSITSLYVGGVTQEISEDDLRMPFSAYGELSGVRKVASRFCAFVQFRDRSAAEAAAEGLHNKLTVKGVRLRLMWGRQQPGRGGGGRGEYDPMRPVPAGAGGGGGGGGGGAGGLPPLPPGAAPLGYGGAAAFPSMDPAAMGAPIKRGPDGGPDGGEPGKRARAAGSGFGAPPPQPQPPQQQQAPPEQQQQQAAGGEQGS